MPQIWRARLTNIEYDSGKKIYADELFRFNSQNTLINLANGGGKTLLIQLLLQVVMPNEMLNKRPLADLLGNKKYTGHILVEWKLDNPEPTYLTTGFCFTRGNDEGDRLKYFLYTLHYREPNEFDIKNLPLVQEKTPLDYAELLTLLRGARSQDTRVTIFDRDDKRRAYLSHLASYNIFEKEWKNIKVTNNVEGGVGEFFAAAKTSKQLLETVLIPAVEEAIFAGEQDAKRLSQAFAQVHQNLIRLPELQKNLHDFQVLRTEGERVLEAVRSFEESQGKLIRDKSRLRKLYNSANSDMSQIKHDLMKIEEQLAIWKTQRIELNYQSDSIPYVRLQQQKEWAEHGKQEAVELFNSATEQYLKADFDWRQSRGFNDYLERAELFGANIALKKRQELASLGQEEQLMELDLARVTFRAILERLCTDLENDYTQSHEANLAMDKRLSEVSDELITLRETDKQLAMKVAMIETALQAYQTKWDELYQVYQNMAWLEDPALALRELTAILTALREKIKVLEERRLGLVEEQRTRTKQIQDLAVQLSENQATLKTYTADKQQAETALLELQEFLGRYSIRCVAPYTEQTRIKAEISMKKTEFQDKIRFECVRLEQLKDQLSLIRESGAYVPNREILKVQRLLDELQIPAQLGSKWLEEQGVNEQDRLGYLRYNPLLPYALVLAEEDFKRLQNNKSFQTGVLSCPVPLLVRRPELVPPAELTPEKLMSVNGGPAYLLWHKGYDYSLSTESLESVVVELEAELERATRSLQTLEVSEEQLRKLSELESSFFSRYPSDYLATLEIRLQNVKKQLELDLVKKEKLETETTEVELELEEMRTTSESRTNEEHLRSKDLVRFEVWQKEALEHTRQLAERKGVLEEQKETTLCLSQRVGEQVQLTRDRLAGASKHKELEGLRNFRRDELREVPLPSRQDLTPRKVPYEEAKGCWQESENAVSKVHSELKYCEDTIRQNLFAIERLEKGIRDLKLTLAEVEEAKYKTSEEELDQLEAGSHVWKDEIESSRKTVHSKDIEVEGLKGQLTEKETQIKKTYGRTPETGFRDLELALAKLEKEKLSLQRQEHEWTLIQKDTVEQEGTLVDGLKSLATSLQHFEVPASEETLPQEDWLTIRTKLASTIDNSTQELREVQKLVRQLRETGEKSFRGYAEILRRQGNSVVDRFVSHLLADEERRFQLEVMEQAFAKSFEMIARFEEKASFELIEAERNKQELVELSINQAQRIAQEMQMIDRYVKVDYAGKRVNAVQIKLKEWETDKTHALMNAYIDDLIKELKRLAEQGEPEEKQEKFIDKKMSSRQLLNVLANLEQATIRVLKPEQHPTSPYFDPWDDVQKWSGGERYAGYMAMFMAILSYTRSKLSSLHNPYKVMLADNPFGAASSPHVLNLIFQLAESNNIQMICLTALTEDTIFAYFPAVYSLRLRPFMGKDYMTSKIERGFYQIDPLEGELRKKRQIEFEWEQG